MPQGPRKRPPTFDPFFLKLKISPWITVSQADVLDHDAACFLAEANQPGHASQVAVVIALTSQDEDLTGCRWKSQELESNRKEKKRKEHIMLDETWLYIEIDMSLSLSYFYKSWLISNVHPNSGIQDSCRMSTHQFVSDSTQPSPGAERHRCRPRHYFARRHRLGPWHDSCFRKPPSVRWNKSWIS